MVTFNHQKVKNEANLIIVMSRQVTVAAWEPVCRELWNVLIEQSLPEGKIDELLTRLLLKLYIHTTQEIFQPVDPKCSLYARHKLNANDPEAKISCKVYHRLRLHSPKQLLFSQIKTLPPFNNFTQF